MKKISKKQIIIPLILLSVLGLSIYLVGQKIFFESKANEQIYRAVEVKDTQGNSLDCSSGSCETKTLDIEIRLNKEALEN